MSVLPTRIGFFGKMPARGDFVRSTLSCVVADAIHAWMSAVLPSLESLLGRDWHEIWVAARPWRFAAGLGVITPDVMSGVWLPSMDRVGRCYPLLIAIEHTTLDEASLAAIEAVGMVAVHEHLEPEELTRSLAGIPTTARKSRPFARPTILWWRTSGEMLKGDVLALGPDFIELLAP